ncbi:MAG: Ig-like domain-containing protein [Treponema sp.]|jgi:carbon monoxide dehydrogenase subunit G|nr:Ig-like domain-containing protein [Treponema sp.]
MKSIVKYFCIAALAVTAVLFTACFGFDERPEDGGGEFVPVESISGIPDVSVPYIAISLSGTVEPENATNKKAEWSVKADGGTNSVVEGTRLTANDEGTVTVTARIKNGLGAGADYTQDFSIIISLSAPYAVREIIGIPGALPIGDLSGVLNGTVIPSNASYKEIKWSIKDAGTTGAVMYDNTLVATAKGRVVVTATIENGLLVRDFTQDFPILITKSVVAVGLYQEPSDSSYDYRACYWLDGELFPLEVPTAGAKSSAARVIIYDANGDQYIAGSYSTGSNTFLCYWKNGTRTDLINGSNPNANILSIAADGSDIYITGSFGAEYNATLSFYLWKIAGGTGAGELTTLSPSSGNLYTQRYTGRFAVHNGNVYIPFQTTTGCYYWNENGVATAISLLRGYDDNIRDAKVVNGNVYFAGSYGYDYESNGSYGVFYWRMGDSALTIFADGWRINSIVDENGVPAFYGILGQSSCRWDTGGNVTILPAGDTSTVVFSDGDAYALSSVYGLYYHQYMVLTEPFPQRKVFTYTTEHSSNDIFGIAVVP